MAYLTVASPPRFFTDHRLDPRIRVGVGSYLDGNVTFGLWEPNERIDIGRFCSIASGVSIFGGGDHAVDAATTYPFTRLTGQGSRPTAPPRHTTIGDDVWVGAGARILAGSSIGPGSVIGAGAVVRGTIRPYSVSVGNPARVIRSRFPPAIIRRLLELAWWDWPLEKVMANAALLETDPRDWPPTLPVVEPQDT
jgi:acetyltransferase-like isoleucine patch superfamily enzyme